MCCSVSPCVDYFHELQSVTLKGKITETSWEIEFQFTSSPSHRRKCKTFLDTWPHSVFAEENLNICLSIGELVNHKTTAEVIGIMNVDLHFSVIYYQFQKRIWFYFSEVKKIFLMKTTKMFLFLLHPNICLLLATETKKSIIYSFLVNGLSLSGL